MSETHWTLKYAQMLDQTDPLGHLRSRFYLLPETIYMDGNSLGLMSQDSERTLVRVLDEWKTLGINGWMKGSPAWYYFGEHLGSAQSKLVGAYPDEVVATNSTTVNLHNLVAGFFEPTSERNIIIADELNFPSDIYAIQSQLKLKNLDPLQHLKLVKSRDGKTLVEQDIIDAMTPNTSLVLLPSVLYRSGQLLDIKTLTQAAHEKGVIIGFDCSHSVGSVPHHFSEWEVDFAFWCNYKYLNGGPGCTASLYVNRKHHSKTPGLTGWWGYHKDRQFDMRLDYESPLNAGAWQIGTINMLGSAALEGSLRIFEEIGIEAIRIKSLKQTEYFMGLIDYWLPHDQYGYTIGTPREAIKRGGHVAVEHADAIRIAEALKARKVIPDFRYPNVIRLAPVALYTSYEDIWNVVHHLKEIIDQQEHLAFTDERPVVS